jgi:hypothetical protein
MAVRLVHEHLAGREHAECAALQRAQVERRRAAAGRAHNAERLTRIGQAGRVGLRQGASASGRLVTHDRPSRQTNAAST